MIILIDSREKQNQHITKRLKELNIPYMIQKLDCGDYSFEKDGVSFENKIFIERKNSISEICGNFAQGKFRFSKEFERAYMKKAKIHLMIEDSEDFKKGDYRSRFSPQEIKSRLLTWCHVYQIKLAFVTKEQACDYILETFQKNL